MRLASQTRPTYAGRGREILDRANLRVRRSAWLQRALGYSARLLGPRSYFAIALALSAAIVVDGALYPFMRGLEKQTFDFMMRVRAAKAAPDPDIVIVDIDEPSLASMGREFGRWPWPRAVLAELLDAIEAQGPRAIVFDILFSDPDVQNPGSDALFNEAVARSRHGYFPMLRLDRGVDAKSELKASQVPGAERRSGDAADPTVAMVLPGFPAIVASDRSGITNAEPDSDGVVRRYVLYEDAGAWRLPSLPWKLARDLGFELPASRDIVINWRGGPFSYRAVSFADAHADALRKEKRRDPREFAGKIVLVGATAAGLFDLKASPMARAHPGVEILATAIDNLKHGDYYRVPGAVFSTIASLALVWSLAAALRFGTRGVELGPALYLIQLALLLVAYVSLNLSRFYIDLAAPVAFGVAFLVLANVRMQIRERAATRSGAFHRGERIGLSLLLLRPAGERVAPRTRARLLDLVCSSRASARLAEQPFRGRGLLGQAFAGLIIVYWQWPAGEEQLSRAARDDQERFRAALEQCEALRVSEHAAEMTWDGPRAARDVLIDALHTLKEGRI